MVVALFEQVAELRRTVAALANEIARLKGGLGISVRNCVASCSPYTIKGR